MNKAMGDLVFMEEEYRTLFAEITASINSRPLWAPSEGDIDQPAITCQDLLRSSNLNHSPEILNADWNPKKSYQRIQKVANEWWKLWLRHFVPTLQRRSKWFKSRENLENDDVVLLMDEDTKRSQWKLGRVTKTYPGKDGRVRSVEVKIIHGTYNRPVTKLCLLVSNKRCQHCIQLRRILAITNKNNTVLSN